MLRLNSILRANWREIIPSFSFAGADISAVIGYSTISDKIPTLNNSD
jgi:hypothetical protein